MTRMIKILAALTTAVFAVFFVPSTQALTVPCYQGDGVELFEKTHEEYPVGRGIASDGASYFLLVNSKTKTWTMVIKRPGPGDFFCPVASGNEFELMPPPKVPTKQEKLTKGKTT